MGGVPFQNTPPCNDRAGGVLQGCNLGIHPYDALLSRPSRFCGSRGGLRHPKGVHQGWTPCASLDEDEKGVCQGDTLGGRQNLAIVSEPGLYRQMKNLMYI